MQRYIVRIHPLKLALIGVVLCTAARGASASPQLRPRPVHSLSGPSISALHAQQRVPRSVTRAPEGRYRATLLALPGAPPPVFGDTLAAPQNVSAQPQVGAIALSWDAVTGAVGYDVFLVTAGNNGSLFKTKINADPITGTTYTDQGTSAAGLSAHQSYTYVIAAIADLGGPPLPRTYGKLSAPVAAMPLAPPVTYHVTLKPFWLGTNGEYDQGGDLDYQNATTAGANTYVITAEYAGKTLFPLAHAEDYKLLGTYQVNNNRPLVQVTLAPTYDYTRGGGKTATLATVLTYAPAGRNVLSLLGSGFDALGRRLEWDGTIAYTGGTAAAGGAVAGFTPDLTLVYHFAGNAVPLPQLAVDYTFQNAVSGQSWDVTGTSNVGGDATFVEAGLSMGYTVHFGVGMRFR